MSVSGLLLKWNSTVFQRFDLTRFAICRWGGIPRFVLEKNKAEDDLLDEAVNSCDLRQLRNSIGGNNMKKNVPNKLLHMNVQKDFKTRRMLLGSDVIAEKVIF